MHRGWTQRAAVAALIALGMLQVRASHAAPAPAVRFSHATLQANGDIQHPVSVRVTALDPIVRGATVRLHVQVNSAVTVERAVIDLSSVSGTASRVGASRVTLGSLAPGRERTADFTVSIPSSGGRGYAQFLVQGEGPYGKLTRGAAINLLPDGPDQVGRVVALPGGGNTREFSARRIN